MTQLLDNETRLLEQITKINERLYLIERKMDLIVTRMSPKVLEPKPALKVAPSPVNPAQFAISLTNQNNHNQQNNQSNQNNRPKERPMYTAICADCKKECSIPFKPSGDRPVYCKDCFGLRRSMNTFKPKVEEITKEIPNAAPVAQAVIEKPKKNKTPVKAKQVTKAKTKVVALKKSAPKKKLVTKKSRRK